MKTFEVKKGSIKKHFKLSLPTSFGKRKWFLMPFLAFMNRCFGEFKDENGGFFCNSTDDQLEEEDD